MRFSWIEGQWDEGYIRRAKATILKTVSTILHLLSQPLNPLVQMHRYRNQTSSGDATAASNLPAAQPTPVATDEPSSTRFKIKHSVYDKKPTQATSVEVEFRNYSTAGITSDKTGILRFWEVRFLFEQYCY
jgi:hypothetical protein